MLPGHSRFKNTDKDLSWFLPMSLMVFYLYLSYFFYSVLKKHERTLSYTCMSAVESSTALASCLHEITKHK